MSNPILKVWGPLIQVKLSAHLIGLVDARLRTSIAEPELASPGGRLVAAHIDTGQTRPRGSALRVDSRTRKLEGRTGFTGLTALKPSRLYPTRASLIMLVPKVWFQVRAHVLDALGLVLRQNPAANPR